MKKLILLIVSLATAYSNAQGPLRLVNITISPVPCAVDFNALPLDVTCSLGHDGQIQVTDPRGGTCPINPALECYTFSVDGGAFTSEAKLIGLTPGAHSVTVKDITGCTTTKTVNVGDGTITFAAQEALVPVGGATIDITATGGTPGTGNVYTYALDNVPLAPSTTGHFINVPVGAHTWSVTDSSTPTANVLTGTVFVSPSNSQSVSLTLIPPCNGTGMLGDINVAVSYPTRTADMLFTFVGDPAVTVSPPFQHTFTKPASGATTYEVQIAIPDDRAVGTQSSFSLGFPFIAASAIDFVATPQPTCPGKRTGEIEVSDITGGVCPSAIYSWLLSWFSSTPVPTCYTISIDNGPFGTSTQFTGLGKGPHTITVKDSKGCTTPKTVIVPEYTPIEITKIKIIAPRCDGGTDGRVNVKQVSGGTAPYEYTVKKAKERCPAYKRIGQPFTCLKAGRYCVIIRDSNGCETVHQIVVPDHQ